MSEWKETLHKAIEQILLDDHDEDKTIGESAEKIIDMFALIVSENERLKEIEKEFNRYLAYVGYPHNLLYDIDEWRAKTK